MHNESYVFTSIGTIESCYPLKYGTPRQGAVAPSSRARLHLHPHIDANCFDDIEGYSHLWILFIFHENGPFRFHAKVKPPRLDGHRIGVFASRAPHRINNIGQTLVRFVKREGRVMHLTGIDIIDGTPCIDVKPAHWADVPQPLHTFRMPCWMEEKAMATLAVQFLDEARKELHDAIPQLRFYKNDMPGITAVIHETLTLDPREVYVKRRDDPNSVWGMIIDRLNVLYCVANAVATVIEVQLIDDRELAELRASSESPPEKSTLNIHTDGIDHEKILPVPTINKNILQRWLAAKPDRMAKTKLLHLSASDG